MYLLPDNYKEIFILGSEEDLNQIKNLLKSYKYDEKLKFKIIDYNFKSNIMPNKLIITKEKQLSQNESNLIKDFIFNGVQITSKYKWFENELNCLPVDLIDKENIIDSKLFLNNKDFQFKLKRLFDIILSFFLLIISFPIILCSGLLIWLSDRGPIFYKQEREGLFRKKINIYKLRSMIVNAESCGPQWASKNDKRITLIGKILRKTRIDELPQLISVLKGDMSLIGPRPERPQFNNLLEKEIPYYDLRHLLKPGLSGWAQVNYTYSSSLSESKNKLSYDLFYISNYSIFLDLLILCKTIRIIFNGSGI
jgi:exopolysaccharide biosynthesis polyprenyl glycosylphosphotransferase